MIVAFPGRSPPDWERLGTHGPPYADAMLRGCVIAAVAPRFVPDSPYGRLANPGTISCDGLGVAVEHGCASHGEEAGERIVQHQLVQQLGRVSQAPHASPSGAQHGPRGIALP